jgi:hypothetical protein
MLKRCRIQQYDPAVTTAPFQFITLVEVAEVDEPEGLNDGGNEFANRLADMCDARGYQFRFYSTHSTKGESLGRGAAPGLKKLKLNGPGASPKLQEGPKIDYDVVVFGEFERRYKLLKWDKRE